MAKLAPEPKDWELEDFVSAHFASRGCYVETCVTERIPDEILELDIVWTDYREDPGLPRPVEVKSGGWGFSDVFRFFGWTEYLGLSGGQFVHRQECGRSDPGSVKLLARRTGIDFLHVPKAGDLAVSLEKFGLPNPPWADLPELWRYSFWARRRLMKSLNKGVELNVCPQAARVAKNYRHLVNDAVFFIPLIADRVERLLSAHFAHPQLARSAAYECESGKLDLDTPPSTDTFRRALFYGAHFPVQACMYLDHRARLYLLKALVDYWLKRQRNEIVAPAGTIRVGRLVLPRPSQLSSAMEDGIRELSTAKTFRLFPVFWQVYLWSWGGFLLKDRIDEEFAALEAETGVPVCEIPIALAAFDKIFPVKGGWFKHTSNLVVCWRF